MFVGETVMSNDLPAIQICAIHKQEQQRRVAHYTESAIQF